MKKPKRRQSLGFWYSDMRNQEQGYLTMKNSNKQGDGDALLQPQH